MSILDPILNLQPISQIRRNHALEHATLQVLTQKDPARRLAGYSDAGGFWVLGDVSLEALQEAVEEAQKRLRAGERKLAIHPYCGTNFVTTGFVAGSFAWLATLGSGRSMRDKFDRWPLMISMVTLAMIAAQPLGPKVQENFTTEPELGSQQVTGILRYTRNSTPLHRVTTSF